MLAFSNKVIPIDDMLQGKRIDFALIVQNAKKSPGEFVLEAFALVMMIVGAYTFAKYAYELGKWVGRSIG